MLQDIHIIHAKLMLFILVIILSLPRVPLLNAKACLNHNRSVPPNPTTSPNRLRGYSAVVATMLKPPTSSLSKSQNKEKLHFTKTKLCNQGGTGIMTPNGFAN